MQICPHCNNECDDQPVRCPHCQYSMKNSSEHISGATNEMICSSCNIEVDPDSDYCPHCGVLFISDPLFCSMHPSQPAEGVCIICSQIFCSQCLTQKTSRYLCTDHRHVELSQDWSVVFSSIDFYEAQIIRGRLESAGITVNPINTGNPGYLSDGMIESAIGRAVLRYPIKIYVPLHQYLDAVQILTEE